LRPLRSASVGDPRGRRWATARNCLTVCWEFLLSRRRGQRSRVVPFHTVRGAAAPPRVQKGAHMTASPAVTLVVRVGVAWTVVSVLGALAVGRTLRLLRRVPVRTGR